MLWSLIYRKLKGKRGNTMITLYEATRLTHLISRKNNYKLLKGKDYTYDGEQICISNYHYEYKHDDLKIDILPRLIKKNSLYQKFEVYLQLYITQNLGLGVNETLDKALDIKTKDLEWLGNEVSCGVGMQRIDIMLKQEDNNNVYIRLIELKDEAPCENILKQISWYLEWLSDYVLPNYSHKKIKVIPTIIAKGPLKPHLLPKYQQYNPNLNNANICPLEYIGFSVNNNSLDFTKYL